MNICFKNITNINKDDILLLRTYNEILRDRALLLDEPDRTLIITYLDNENSFRQIAKLTGENETTISRRIKKIIKRLENNTHIVTVKNIHKLDNKERKVARDYFIKGISIRRLTKKYRISIYKIRKIIRIVESATAKHSGKVNERKY